MQGKTSRRRVYAIHGLWFANRINPFRNNRQWKDVWQEGSGSSREPPRLSPTVFQFFREPLLHDPCRPGEIVL